MKNTEKRERRSKIIYPLILLLFLLLSTATIVFAYVDLLTKNVGEEFNTGYEKELVVETISVEGADKRLVPSWSPMGVNDTRVIKYVYNVSLKELVGLGLLDDFILNESELDNWHIKVELDVDYNNPEGAVKFKVNDTVLADNNLAPVYLELTTSGAVEVTVEVTFETDLTISNIIEAIRGRLGKTVNLDINFALVQK